MSQKASARMIYELNVESVDRVRRLGQYYASDRSNFVKEHFMKRVFFGGLILLFFFTTALPATMGNKVNVAHVGGKVRWSQVALGADGIAHLAFVEILDEDVRNPLYYVSYDGQKASSPILLTRSLDTYAMQPHIAANSRGQVAVVWSEPRDGSIFMRVLDPQTKTWGSEQRVSNWGVDEPSVAIDKDGNIHVFFYDSGDGRSYCRSKINGVWEREFLLSRSDVRCVQGNVALAKDGTVWACWLQQAWVGSYAEYKTHYRKRLPNSTTWLPQSWVNESGESQERPNIGVGPNGIPWVTWQDVDPGESTQIAICKLDESSNPMELITGRWTQHYPRVAVDANNNVHLAIPQGAGDEGDGMLYKSNVGGGWSAQELPGPWTKAGGISVDDFGNVAVCVSAFFQADGSDVLLYSLEPISPKYFLPPVNLSVTVVMGSLKISPKITYNLSWSANPDNYDAYLNGYKIYMKENTGSYQLLTSVTKSTFSQSFEFSDISKKRRFAISTVNLGGGESVLVEF